MKLMKQDNHDIMEAGLDEAGRGCLAGPVVAAAVILPKKFRLPGLNDSKQLTHEKRMILRDKIMDKAECFAIGVISAPRIDQVNILNASFEAMAEAIDCLHIRPDALLIDGHMFRPKHSIPYKCMIGGDGRYMNIAAASILAKTFRDEMMDILHEFHPQYSWNTNKGYATRAHRLAIQEFGTTGYHRQSFTLTPDPTLFDELEKSELNPEQA